MKQQQQQVEGKMFLVIDKPGYHPKDPGPGAVIAEVIPAEGLGFEGIDLSLVGQRVRLMRGEDLEAFQAKAAKEAEARGIQAEMEALRQKARSIGYPVG